MKQCTKCKQTKVSTEFYKNRQKRDGLASNCNLCYNTARTERNKYKPDYSAMKQCTNCKQTKAPTEFGKDFRLRDGLDSRCRVCYNAASKKRYKYTPGAMKQCTSCKQTKAPTEFYKNGRKRDGLASNCKVCSYTPHKKRDAARAREDEDGGHKKKRFRRTKEEMRLGLSSEQCRKARLKKEYGVSEEEESSDEGWSAERKLNGCGPKRKYSASAGNGSESARHSDPSLEATVYEGCFNLHGITHSIVVQHQRDVLLPTITELQHQVTFDTAEHKLKCSFWV